MKKFLSYFIFLVAFGVFSPAVYATPAQLAPGTYVAPQGNETIASQYLEVDHLYYYTWCIEDLRSNETAGRTLEVVFHDVYDFAVEEDYLNVFIRDGNAGDALGWNMYGDGESLTIPNWSSDPAWTFIDVWSDPAGHPRWIEGPTYDVVFTLNIDQAWADKLANGGSFVIGIDPDCHYYGSEVTVNAPVPEPATFILIGSGLLGLAGFRRKKL